MIEFKNVSASYDGELAVLRDVSFTVGDGDFVAFVGTNGAGKSTTMRLANGLLKPTAGEVIVDGVPTTALKTSELARRIGFLFQNPDRQICCNTVREELLFGFKALGEEGLDAEERVDAIIERFGFDADAHHAYIDRIFARFQNPFLEDETQRVAREPIRKLAPTDRLIKPLTTAYGYGLNVDHLIFGAAAALHFNCPEDEQSVELQQAIQDGGVERFTAGAPEDLPGWWEERTGKPVERTGKPVERVL